MGAECFEMKFFDDNIESSNSVEDLIIVFSQKYNNFDNEINQIKEHLKDHSAKVEYVNVEGIKDEYLKNRIIYLQKLKETFSEIISTLEDNLNANIEVLRPILNNILSKYYLTFDRDNELEVEMKKFYDIFPKPCNNLTNRTI